MAKPRTIKAYAERRPQAPDLQRWWKAESSQVHAHLVQLIRLIQENQRDHQLADLRHAYLYNNCQINSALVGSVGASDDVTYNVVKSCVDTVTAKIAQRELRPRVLTERGDYAKQLRARKLSRYLDGLLQSSDVYRLGPQILRDACIFGTGALKVIPDYEGESIMFERVLVKELLVDELEAQYGNPQSLYQVRLVSQDMLAEQFPEKRQEILAARSAGDDEWRGNGYRNRAVDMVQVFEGWHLGQDSRHVIAIEGATLHDEPWEQECFPFAFCRYLSKIDSFYGCGIAEELVGTQLEINKMLRDIQRAQHMIAVPRVLLDRSSRVVPAHLTNEIGSVLKYEGAKPEFINPTAMNNEIYSHVKWLIQTAYEKVGVSTLSASSKKPSGVDSKVALRELSNIESERFAVTEKNYQDFFQDIAKLAVEWSRQLYKGKRDVAVRSEDRRFIETIKWSEVDLDDDSMTTQIHLSSLLPTAPAARLQKVEEYVKAGWMDRETALQQFSAPDVEAWETLETADKELVESMISDILESGTYRAPEPEMDPTKAVNYARKVYLGALRTGAPDDRLELLLRWMDAAASLLPELAAPATPALGLPQAGPEALPTSPLLPVPGV